MKLTDSRTARAIYSLFLVALTASVLASCTSSDSATEPSRVFDGSRGVHAEGGDASDSKSGGGGSGGSSDSATANPDLKAGQLTAGEWSDLDNWGFWLGLASDSRLAEAQSRWRFNTGERIVVDVVDRGRPVLDAIVSVTVDGGPTLFEARTDNRGRANLFPSISTAGGGKYDIEVRAGSKSAHVDDVVPSTLVTAASVRPVVVELPNSAFSSGPLDLMFMVDATGSMTDEMEYIKAELRDVVDRVRAGNDILTRIRLSCNVYRDQGDEYVVRSFPFTESVDEVERQIREQSAGGGGDYPEAVEAALKSAIEDHQWSDRARARIMILVLDAPPHEQQEIIETVRTMTLLAAKKGIRIIPVASSGIDKGTEFLLRFMSVTTGGTYVFLTDHSGIGNSHLVPTVGDYDVELLNDLLVRVIGEYVSEP